MIFNLPQDEFYPLYRITLNLTKLSKEWWLKPSRMIAASYKEDSHQKEMKSNLKQPQRRTKMAIVKSM